LKKKPPRKNQAESHGCKAIWQAESRLLLDAIVPVQQPNFAKAMHFTPDKLVYSITASGSPDEAGA
jgi:hypothetical protein